SKRNRDIYFTLIINLNVPTRLALITICLEESVSSRVRSYVCIICFVDCNRCRRDFSSRSCSCVCCGDIMLNKGHHVIKLPTMFLGCLLLHVCCLLTFYVLLLPSF